MAGYLPQIFSAGTFHSREKFSDPIKYPDHSLSRPRIVNSYELELFLETDGLMYLNDTTYERKRGALLIAKPGDKRQSTLHFSAIFLHFGCNDPDIKELLHQVQGFHSNLDYDQFAPALLDICETVRSFEPDCDLVAAAKLISFLCEVKKQSVSLNGPEEQISNFSVVSEAVEYMKRNYMFPLTVEKLAEHSCLSTSYFHKIFCATAHITPNNYLLNIRLSHARSMLITSTKPISEIASKCGFNSQAYFSDCFKRKFSISPREFRKSFAYPDIETISPIEQNMQYEADTDYLK